MGAFHSTKITGSNFRNFRWSNGTRQTASQDSRSRAESEFTKKKILWFNLGREETDE